MSWPRGDRTCRGRCSLRRHFPRTRPSGPLARPRRGVSNELVYEHRLGRSADVPRIKVPIDVAQQEQVGRGAAGPGDIEIAMKRAFYANQARGQIFAAGWRRDAPHRGRGPWLLGNGFAVDQAFAMWGQIVLTNGFLHVQTGFGMPSDQTPGDNEGFVRTAFGYTMPSDTWVGRAGSPMGRRDRRRKPAPPLSTGSWPPDSDLAEQVAARPAQRRRAHAAARSRRIGVRHVGAGPSAAGLVRRRSVRVLEIRLQLAITVWVMSLFLLLGRAAVRPAPDLWDGKPDRGRESHQGRSLFADARRCVESHYGLITPAG